MESQVMEQKKVYICVEENEKEIIKIVEILRRIKESRAFWEREEREFEKHHESALYLDYQDDDGVPDIDILHWSRDRSISALKEELTKVISEL